MDLPRLVLTIMQRVNCSASSQVFYVLVTLASVKFSNNSQLQVNCKKCSQTFIGEKTKNFEIEILYNKRRNWALSFTVLLGPDEVVNAEIGNVSKAIVTIPKVESLESLILPSVPIVSCLQL